MVRDERSQGPDSRVERICCLCVRLQGVPQSLRRQDITHCHPTDERASESRQERPPAAVGGRQPRLQRGTPNALETNDRGKRTRHHQEENKGSFDN